MTRREIVSKYTEEIMELAKRDMLSRDMVGATINCALTEMHIMVTDEQVKTLQSALASLGSMGVCLVHPRVDRVLLRPRHHCIQ